MRKYLFEKTQVVPGSGHGWKLFKVFNREGGTPGAVLKSNIVLDYEDQQHRRGFRFKIQVTDKVNFYHDFL